MTRTLCGDDESIVVNTGTSTSIMVRTFAEDNAGGDFVMFAQRQ